MSTGKTVEKKAAVRNSISRIVFATFAIVAEAAFLIVVVKSVSEFASWLSLIAQILAIALVLYIYGRHQSFCLKTPWIILILLLPVLGSCLYLMVGLSGSTKRMKERYREIDRRLLPRLPAQSSEMERLRERSVGGGNLSRYLYDMAGYPVYENTDVQFYPLASIGFEALKKDLQQSSRYIFMEYHAIEDADAFHEIEEILVAKAEAGVEVRIFYDDLGSATFVNKDFRRRLDEEGIQCRVFNPVTPLLNVFLDKRDHRKMTVIDGRVAYTGGWNLANEYFNITHPYGEWKDTGIRLEGDAVRSMTVMFLEMWNAMRGRRGRIDEKALQGDLDRLPQLLPEPAYRAREHGWVQPYADSPVGEEPVAENVYLSIIEQAQEYVYFVTPYLIITDEMDRVLGLVAKRGVDVRIITPGIPDKKIIYELTRSYYAALARSGVRIFEYTPGFCHAKQCVADGRIATCGSINLDYRSLYHHFENGCVLYDCQAVEKIRDDFETMFSRSYEVTEEYRTGRSRRRRFGQLLLRLIAPLL